MPVPELANFRQKYPDYNDLSDADLAGMLAKKYPESYGDLPAKVGTGSSVAPNSLAADPMNMTGAERKKWAREREKFTADTGTLGTQIRQNLFDPNQEYVTDSPVAALTKSLGNTVGSVISMPKDIYKKFQTALDPNSADNQKARQYDDNTTLQDLAMIGREAGGALQDIGAPVGLRGIEGLKESWGKSPVQSLATVGMIEPLIGRGVKGAAAGAADMAGRTADLASSRLMDMTLKQGTTLKTAKRQQNVQTALEGGYIPNKKGVDKLSADITATEKALGDGIAAGDAAQVRGTLDKAISNVESLREEAKRSADPAKYNAMIDAEVERLRGSPMVDESGTIPIGDIQKMKVEQGRTVKYQTKNGQAPDPFQASIDKARIRGMKEELETQLFDVFPELKTTNQKLSNFYGLQDVLERAANRIEQNQGVGIALPIKSGSGAAIGGMMGGAPGAALGGGIGAMIGIIEHPSVAPRLARAIFNARKGKISPERARGIVDERLSAITDRLKSKDNNIEARASGGPISAGKPYLVGEKGPELVIPDQGGTVIPAESPISRAAVTLNQNMDKNFVTRIMAPHAFPVLPHESDPGYGTHEMSYATDDNGAVVFPRIVQGQDGTLFRPSDPYLHAMKTGEFIRMPNEQAAQEFSTNYKGAAKWDDKIYQMMQKRADDLRAMRRNR